MARGMDKPTALLNIVVESIFHFAVLFLLLMLQGMGAPTPQPEFWGQVLRHFLALLCSLHPFGCGHAQRIAEAFCRGFLFCRPVTLFAWVCVWIRLTHFGMYEGEVFFI